MSAITKPMLAERCEDLSALKFPVLATPKIDGIRCLILPGNEFRNRAVSRKFKDIPNKFIRNTLAALPAGLDGELMLRDPKATFQAVTSAVMSEDGQPDFVYNVFDYVTGDINYPYNVRMNDLRALKLPAFCNKILPESLGGLKQLEKFEAQCLAEGYEGVMVRSYAGPYKCGRSTVKEGFLLKIKRFKDSEAVVLGFTERMHNENTATKDELGHTKRSSAKAGLVPAGTLGTLVVRDATSGVEFEIGTGFDDGLRKAIWDNQKNFLTRLVKYKSQEIGTKDKPRFPVFLGFRDRRDL